MVYFITREMHVFSHQFAITWEKTAKSIERREPGKYPTKQIVLGEPVELVLILFPQYRCLFPLDSGILHYMGNACVCSSNFRQHQKSQQNASNGEDLGIWSPYFLHKVGGFFPIPQYTSSYGKYMSFLINFPQHGKRQESPSNGKSLENWFTRKSYKTHRIFFLLSMGNFLPSDFDLIVYMGNVWLFRSFSISTGNAAKCTL